MVALLMKTEGAINGGDIGDGMLVDEDVPMDFQQNGEIIERLDIPFHLVAGHELHYNLDPLLARLVQILILNVERRLSHVPLL